MDKDSSAQSNLLFEPSCGQSNKLKSNPDLRINYSGTQGYMTAKQCSSEASSVSPNNYFSSSKGQFDIL